MNLVVRQKNALQKGAFPRGGVLPWAGAILSVAPAAAFGLTDASIGLGVAAVAPVVLVIVLSLRRGRQVFTGLSGWPMAALAFGLGCLALASAMTPFAPGGVHPLWAAVGQGAAVLDLEAALCGLLALGGLAALFCVFAVLGARPERTRQAALALQWLLLVVAAAMIAAGLSGLKPVQGLPSALAGLGLLLSAGSCAQSWKAERPRGWLGRLRAAPGSIIAALLFTALLALAGGVGALAAAGFSLAVFSIWESLAKGGEGKLRRGPLLLVLGLVGLAMAAVALSILAMADAPAGSAQAISNAVHWKAVLASPWLGYGPYSGDLVARLSMDRLTVGALQAAPLPSSAYLAALEQGGVLESVPIALALGAIVWSIIDASVRRRRLTTFYRVAVASVGFYLLYGVVSPAPLALAAVAPLVLMLGCSFGAARSGR
jgi:hypothetical protein